jgi:hypothetical protein
MARARPFGTPSGNDRYLRILSSFDARTSKEGIGAKAAAVATGDGLGAHLELRFAVAASRGFWQGRRRPSQSGGLDGGPMMLVEETAIPAVKIVTPKKHGDARGFFSEVYSQAAWEGRLLSAKGARRQARTGSIRSPKASASKLTRRARR